VARTNHSGFGRYPLENVALGLLMAGPQHGYGLYQDFTRNFGSIWKAGQTKFYVALTRLESQGYLRATTEAQEGRPARKVYHLTPQARDVFLGWLHRPVESMRAIRVEFIAKLRFFDILGLPGGAQLIDAQAEVLQAMLDEWEQAASVQDDDSDTFYTLVDDFRQRQARFFIEWLAACRPRFE
jgi:DNA-binding PadR family transcriptional regulator